MGNSDRNTLVSNTFTTPVYARLVRILPLTWYWHISLRLELYGCKEGKSVLNRNLLANLSLIKCVRLMEYFFTPGSRQNDIRVTSAKLSHCYPEAGCDSECRFNKNKT